MKKLTLACALILASVGLKAQITTGKDVAVVATDAGKVRGYVHSGIYTYKGIPYAEAARLRLLTSQSLGLAFVLLCHTALFRL
mgnify:CR=1 FL=1